MRRCIVLALAVALLTAAASACGAGGGEPAATGRAASPAAAPVTEHTPEPTATPLTSPPPAGDDAPGVRPTATAAPVVGRPAWLGTRVLPARPDGFGEAQPTPDELVDRRLPPPETGLPSPEGDAFAATVGPVPDEVAARSTWSPACPVGLDELRYLTVAFWGFDERPHTGELIVHVSAADDLVAVFERLFDARFPIEEMRVVAPDELDAPPTGDGNNTTAFVCRPARGSQRWSEHAVGLAVDINPFHNPYVHGDVVLPELASAYVDRGDPRPGMIRPGDVVTESFSAIGWGWGGDWGGLDDWMHFSASGR